MIDELVAFTSTHLAMVTLLMPWKKIVLKDTVDDEVYNKLWTLWDMMNVEKWYYKMSGGTPNVEVEDESLGTMTLVFLVLVFMSLALAIVKWGIVTFFSAMNPDVTSVVDFLSWGTVLSLLITMVVSQADFDASFAHHYRQQADTDTDKMFLSLGVVVIHLAVLSYFVGKDVMDRLKQ